LLGQKTNTISKRFINEVKQISYLLANRYSQLTIRNYRGSIQVYAEINPDCSLENEQTIIPN